MEPLVESEGEPAQPLQPADVMLVCRNGHVITATLYQQPQQAQAHCDRCGAETLDRCGTCGQPLRGSAPLPGLSTVGRPQPPAFCELCGAPFPWTPAAAAPAPRPDGLAQLEGLLRRLPRVARHLRDRHGGRPAFRVADEYDLQDLVRALLPVHFDDVRPESRTPPYSPGTRTDFRLASADVVLTVKLATPALRVAELAAQWHDDIRFYSRQPPALLVGFVYDPQGLLHDPARLEGVWAGLGEGMALRCVIAT